MTSDDIKTGITVKVTGLWSSKNLLAGPEHLAHRREGAKGQVVAVRPDEHDAILWVEHDGGTAPYWQHEVEKTADAPTWDDFPD